MPEDFLEIWTHEDFTRGFSYQAIDCAYMVYDNSESLLERYDFFAMILNMSV